MNIAEQEEQEKQENHNNRRTVYKWIKENDPQAIGWFYNLECQISHELGRLPTPQEYWKEYCSWKRDLNHLPF